MASAHKTDVYLVGKKTGQVAPDGTELIVVYAIRLTRAEADNVCLRFPGTEVIKQRLDRLRK